MVVHILRRTAKSRRDKEVGMGIPNWPQTERPREKLLARGAQTLSDAELLAILIRTGTKGKSALDLARELLVRHGGLRPLLEAEYADPARMPGYGPAKFVQLKAAVEISRRHLEATLKREAVISNPQATRQYLIAKLRGHQREVFACMFLDNRHRVIDFEELFFGTIDSASVHPREVVKRALRHNAAAVILAHNHPSGVAEPSRADGALTQRLREALDLVDVRLLDHVVIGDGDVVSLAERGLI
jgi:DNA repair protein RadC